MKGYKVFHKDWTCRGKHYTCPGYFEEDVKPKICNAGMHFCERALDCFDYYCFNTDNHVAEVEAVGEIDTDGEKYCTNKLKIIREIPWNEVLKLVNVGKDCTGRGNTGNYNAGHYNTGEANTGNCNTGSNNAGEHNAGHYNTGEANTGDCNAGDRNAGNRNAGDFNTGDWNIGSRNTGDWNFTDRSTGCFCTEEQHIKIFDKETNWAINDWRRSNGYRVMLYCPQKTKVVEWIEEGRMSEKEKEDNPTYKTTGGYLRVTEEYSERQAWWDSLDEDSKNCVYDLPNFDAEKFYKCTGIKVDGK